MTPTKRSPQLLLLRVFAVLTALLAVAQTVLGLMIAFGNENMLTSHEPTAYIASASSVVAAIAAGLWAKTSRNKGMAWHALAVAILALAQIGLAEMHLRTIHISVGVLFLIAAVALATLAMRKPGGRPVTGSDRTGADRAGADRL